MSETTAPNAREAAHDTALAAAYDRLNAVAGEMESIRVNLHQSLRIEPTYERGPRRNSRRVAVYPHTLNEVLAVARERLGDGSVDSWDVDRLLRKLDQAYDARIRAGKARADVKRLNAGYEGWSRFFLVPGGHIHSSMNCQTCNRNGSMTAFGWLPELSGLTEKDAVDAHGTILCSVCYPSAPVEWTVGPQAQADPDECPGSRTHDHNSSGTHYYYRRAECDHCGQTVNVTSTGKLRKHKKEA